MLTSVTRACHVLGRVIAVWRKEGVGGIASRLRNRLVQRRSVRRAALAVPPMLAIDTDLSRTYTIGRGSLFQLGGWCFHPARKIRSLTCLMDGAAYPVQYRRYRADVYATFFPNIDRYGYSVGSGFRTILPLKLDPSESSAVRRLQLRVEYTDRTSVTLDLPALKIRRADPVPDRRPVKIGAPRGAAPLVAVCMATYNPPPDLFRRQVESIRQQDHKHWVCLITDDGSEPARVRAMKEVIGDDPRFVLHRNEKRLGFYRNFEHCLTLVPPEADFVTLSDQDDYWYPDKLSSLLHAFEPQTQLVYSDMRIVTKEGDVVAPTYWTTRPNSYDNIASLLLANTVTGAASMFRARLLELVLPFPDCVGAMFHDHWLACVALATGSINYVDRPLYDYVQHGNNVIGHCVPKGGLFGAILRMMKSQGLRKWVFQMVCRHLAVYDWDVARVQQVADALEFRCSDALVEARRPDIRRIARMTTSPAVWLWLVARGFPNFWGTTETVGAELRLTFATLIGKYVAVERRARMVHKRIVAPWRRLVFVPKAVQPAAPQPHILDRTNFLVRKVAPLQLRVERRAKPRINLLIPTVDFRYIFGGYITKFNLARLLSERGYAVRLVITDECDFRPQEWGERFASYQGLEKLADQVEFFHAYDRSQPLPVSADDRFIATTWWTAHIAHAAVKDLGQSRFVYLIQEYEPFTFALGTFSALAAQTYNFPHYALFSTELLRDYFRINGYGVYADDRRTGDADSISFQNTITDVGRVTRADLEGRTRRKLLFYARPEDHAARNMFDIGVWALMQVVRDGSLPGEWELNGIGGTTWFQPIELQPGIVLNMLPKRDQEDYADLLREHDLGLSLMYTPHPSLVPIEMASAGMVTVTNTYANKTAPRLREISTNLLAVEPTVEAVAAGLREAARAVTDYDRRVRGAQVSWARTWEQAFNPEVLDRLAGFLTAASGDARILPLTPRQRRAA